MGGIFQMLIPWSTSIMLPHSGHGISVHTLMIVFGWAWGWGFRTFNLTKICIGWGGLPRHALSTLTFFLSSFLSLSFYLHALLFANFGDTHLYVDTTRRKEYVRNYLFFISILFLRKLNFGCFSAFYSQRFVRSCLDQPGVPGVFTIHVKLTRPMLSTIHNSTFLSVWSFSLNIFSFVSC